MAFPSKQKAIYDRLVREIAERYPPGAKLPPERALAARLGIARMTLRGAMARLAREGRIERNVRGTFASGENPPPALGEKRRIVHVLLPCPDYTVRSGASSCSAVRSLIRGAVRAALRYDAQVVTIPVSDTNDPAAFDRNQLAPLRKNDIVLFVGSWYEICLRNVSAGSGSLSTVWNGFPHASGTGIWHIASSPVRFWQTICPRRCVMRNACASGRFFSFSAGISLCAAIAANFWMRR